MSSDGSVRNRCFLWMIALLFFIIMLPLNNLTQQSMLSLPEEDTGGNVPDTE